MEKFAKIFYFLCVTIMMMNGCNSNKSLTSTDDLSSWIGKYEFGEYVDFHSDIRPNPVWIYNIDIYKVNDDDYYAKIEMDGYQTIQRLVALIKGDEKFISFVFKMYVCDYIMGPYEENDILLSFEKIDSTIITYWGKIYPNAEENDESGKVYFEKLGEDDM